PSSSHTRFAINSFNSPLLFDCAPRVRLGALLSNSAATPVAQSRCQRCREFFEMIRDSGDDGAGGIANVTRYVPAITRGSSGQLWASIASAVIGRCDPRDPCCGGTFRKPSRKRHPGARGSISCATLRTGQSARCTLQLLGKTRPTTDNVIFPVVINWCRCLLHLRANIRRC